MRMNSTPTGDRAKAAIRHIDRWLLKQEDESAIDWAYQDLVIELEKLLESMKSIDIERKSQDREEAAERRAIAREQKAERARATNTRPAPDQ